MKQNVKRVWIFHLILFGISSSFVLFVKNMGKGKGSFTQWKTQNQKYDEVICWRSLIWMCGILAVLYGFYCYLASSWPTLGHYQEGSLTHPDVNHTILSVRPKSHWEPCREVGSPCLVEHLVGFEPRTFWFICNTLTH